MRDGRRSRRRRPELLGRLGPGRAVDPGPGRRAKQLHGTCGPAALGWHRAAEGGCPTFADNGTCGPAALGCPTFAGNSAEQTYDVVVSTVAPGDEVSITSHPVTSATAGHTYVYDVTAESSLGLALNYRLEPSAPAAMQIDQVSGRILETVATIPAS